MKKYSTFAILVYMEFADHYPDYPVPTLVILTNHNTARLLRVEGRTLNELSPITLSEGTYDSATHRTELYQALNQAIEAQIAGGTQRVLLCAPEAFKDEILASLSASVRSHINDIVPKNLVSLEIDQVIRILSEQPAQASP